MMMCFAGSALGGHSRLWWRDFVWWDTLDFYATLFFHCTREATDWRKHRPTDCSSLPSRDIALFPRKQPQNVTSIVQTKRTNSPPWASHTSIVLRHTFPFPYSTPTRSSSSSSFSSSLSSSEYLATPPTVVHLAFLAHLSFVVS